MEEKIKHLLVLDKQRLIMLGGLQGAGKSTLTQKFANAGYEIVSPDTERFNLAKKEHGEDKFESELQHILDNYGDIAWKICETKIYDFLKQGKSIVFDATLTNPKARRKVKAWSEKARQGITSVYVDVPKEVALSRNEERSTTIIAVKDNQPIFGRHVPDFVIEDKFINQVLPTKEEGFDEIIILSTLAEDRSNQDIEVILQSLVDDVRGTVNTLKQSNTLKDIFPHLNACWGIEQNNKHHTQTLEEHMIRAAEIIVEKYSNEVSKEELVVLVVTALNHDVGKKDTKEFYGIMLEDYEQLEKNEKVIVKGKNKFGVIIRRQLFKGFYESLVPYHVIKLDENAHFYGHENVGATKTRRNLLELGLDEHFANEVYALILHHMRLPYQLTSNKSLKKFIRTVGEKRVENLLRIRYADKKSSGTQVNFEEFYESLKKQLTDLILKGDGRMHQLPIGKRIRFNTGMYFNVVAVIEEINKNTITLKDVVYEDGKDYEETLTLPIDSLNNIKVIKD